MALAPDGSVVTYLKAKADDPRMTDLWIADVAGGAPRMLIDGRALSPKDRELSEAEKSRRERQGVQTRGVVEYAGTSRAGSSWRRSRATCGSTTRRERHARAG